MPPPEAAELPVRVVLVTAILPKLATPPPSPEELPDTVLLVIVTVPNSFKMPPPLARPAFPLLIVRVPIVTFALRMWKTREALLPLTVSRDEPGPMMIRSSVISSSPVVSVIVPVTVKVIMSRPGFAFESKMACLSEFGPLSFRLVTVRLANGALKDPLRCVIGNPPFAAAPERHV